MPLYNIYKIQRPDNVVSDNAKKFILKELIDWLSNQGIRKLGSSTFSPRSYRLAKRAVRTVSRPKILLTCKNSSKGLKFLQKLLYCQRIFTKHNGKSPAD